MTRPNKAQNKGNKKKIRYASLQNPTIEAIIEENFRFANAEQAQARLQALRENFIISKLPDDIDPAPHELKMWIRGYGLSSKMREQGYIGNYARLEVRRADRTKWTISPVLLSIDKKYHPQRKMPARRHPNWGHPIMRDIKKKRVHLTVESAQKELERLHLEFPEVSIPLTNKMYIMIYHKTKDVESPIKKWVMEIKATDEGDGFYIDNYVNTYQPDARKKAEQDAAREAAASGKPTEAETKTPAMGKFTSQVLLKKSRKRKAPAPAAAAAAKPKDEG